MLHRKPHCGPHTQGWRCGGKLIFRLAHVTSFLVGPPHLLFGWPTPLLSLCRVLQETFLWASQTVEVRRGRVPAWSSSARSVLARSNSSAVEFPPRSSPGAVGFLRGRIPARSSSGAVESRRGRIVAVELSRSSCCGRVVAVELSRSSCCGLVDLDPSVTPTPRLPHCQPQPKT